MEPQNPLASHPAAPHEAHEVLRALAARTRAGSQPGARDDGLRIALAIEGGGMRGTISGGMALALHQLGLVPAFDAVYGASAGAISGAWLLSSRPEGLRGWTEPAFAKTLIRRSALLRGRPVADVRALIEELYQTAWPMDFASVLANPVEYHPLATDAATGTSTDLRPFVTGPAELRLALRASAPCRYWPARPWPSPAAGSTTQAFPSPSPSAPRSPRAPPTSWSCAPAATPSPGPTVAPRPGRSA